MAITLLRAGSLIAVPTWKPRSIFSRTIRRRSRCRWAVARSSARAGGAPGLEEVAREYGAGEVMVVTITHDHAARRHSYELIAQCIRAVCGELGDTRRGFAKRDATAAPATLISRPAPRVVHLHAAALGVERDRRGRRWRRGIEEAATDPSRRRACAPSALTDAIGTLSPRCCSNVRQVERQS